MLLTQSINIKCDEDALLRIITKITDWTPWVIERKNKVGHITFNYNGGDSSNCGIYSAFLSDYWELFKAVSPNIEKFKPNLKKSWITKTIPTGGIFPHIDYKRNSSMLLPLGDNKGSVKYYPHYSFSKCYWEYKYKGPTRIRTNITHSAVNNSTTDRYVIQFYED